jgi:hypothetical protein
VKIVIWTGAAWERWGPPCLDDGIGGSETAAIHMSREFARRGHEVVMFGDHEGYEGRWDHVNYPNEGSLNPSHVTYRRYQEAVEDPKLLACDVLVSSRNKQVARLKPQARAKILWVHDVHVGDDWENDIMAFDRVYCLSKWHKSYFEGMYPHINPEKISVTRNGIDPSLFADLDWRAKTSSFVYSSSPDRGLDVLMDMWPAIKALRPEATLDVYYGFETWRKLLHENKRGLAVVDYLQGRLESMAGEGVTYHGRVGQKELAEAHKKALIWLYPTRFSETYCLHGDSLISIPGDHRQGLPVRVPIKELVGKKNIPVYSFDEVEKRFKISTMLWCKKTKIAPSMLAIDLDDGSTLKLTPKHEVMNFDAEWVESRNLKVGDRLMALHHRYEISVMDFNGRWASESRLVGEWKAGRRLTRNEHVDHSDPLRLNNMPDMLQILSASEHHRKTHTGKVIRKNQAKKFGENARVWIRANMSKVRARNAINGRNLWKKVRDMSPRDRESWLKNRANKKKHTMASMRLSNPSIRNRNHKIIGIRKIPGGPVYDMEVEGTHNFIADGVVVHNCITALEAQAAGCCVVTSKLAGLAETASIWSSLVEGSNKSSGYQEEALDWLGHYYTAWDIDKKHALAPGHLTAQAARAWALKQTWAALAEEWERDFMALTEGK